MEGLHDVHKAQISRYSTWFAAKRDRAIVDRGGDLEDFKSDRLTEEGAIFNYADVQQILNEYHQQVMSRFREELDKTANLSAVFISQLMAQAEASGVYLQVENIAAIEDQSLVNQIGSLAAMGSVPLAPKPQQQLPAVGAPAAGDNIALLTQVEDLKEEKRQLTERNSRVEMELTNISRERSHLSAEVQRLMDAASGTQHAAGADAAAAQEYLRQLHETRAAYDQKVAENDQIRREFNQRLAESSQFRQLKEIVKQKNLEVQDLKQRLISAGLLPPEVDAGGHVELSADSD